jgi:hypothetical protein
MALRRFAVGLSFGLVLVILELPLWAAARPGEDFENRLSAFRKGMIAACAQFQAGKPRESKEQFDTELAALEAAWAGLASDFREAPPGLYAGDGKWPQYFDSVRENLQAMRAAVAGRRYGKAFETCGATCALFVTMHESNGISTVCDKLFEFRKQAKLMLAQIKSGHADAAASRLPSLLAQRDAVVLWPIPEKAASDPTHYRELVAGFSSAADRFAIALTNDSADAALARYAELMEAFTALYNRYI